MSPSTAKKSLGPVSEADLKAALKTCLEEIVKGAKPAVLDAPAKEFYTNHYTPLFIKNLNKPQIGGWKRIKPKLMQVSRAFGAIARDIAAINGSKAVGHDLMLLTASIVQNECRIGLEGNEEGVICS